MLVEPNPKSYDTHRKNRKMGGHPSSCLDRLCPNCIRFIHPIKMNKKGELEAPLKSFT